MRTSSDAPVPGNRGQRHVLERCRSTDATGTSGPGQIARCRGIWRHTWKGRHMTSRGLEILTRDECEQLLDARSFGRVVTRIGDTISAFPVYYVIEDGDITFRTYPGTKLAAAVLRTRVTFEIDDEAEGWSVMVVGHAEEVRDTARRSAALEHLANKWPEGERENVVKIHIEAVTGRRLKRQC
jgi:uncharacterized protein